VGIADLTQGELGSRGSAATRIFESKNSAEILGVDFRVNLMMRDGFFSIDERHIMRIVELIRKCKPTIILANAVSDRHPDHGRASQLVRQAFFYSGLRRIEITDTTAHRAKSLYYYIQDKQLEPDFCVDVTPHVETKMQSIEAYSTQFNVDKKEAIQTPISSEKFTEFIKSKMQVFGRSIGVDYAEGFNTQRTLGVDDITALL
jgi:bacillithiol biosynthesis deacetylase BshB1